MADKPFPTNEPDINLLLQSLVIKLPAHATPLGIDQAELDALINDASNFTYVLTTAQLVTDSVDAFFAFKDDMFNGDPSTTALIMPTFPTIATPRETLPGIKKRLRALLKRIKASVGYTVQIGEDLGLIENDPGALNPDSITAEIKVRALQDGKVEIVFSKQGMDAIRVDFRRKGDVVWMLAGIYTSSAGIHDTPSVPPGEPEAREYRAIMIKKNVPIGNMSPIYTVVTTP